MNRVDKILKHLNASSQSTDQLKESKTAGWRETLGNIIPNIGASNVVYSERHGGELVAQVLQAHGIEFLFTLIGGHISPILVAAKAQGIRVVDVRDEANAVFAAEAVARLTGVPGVAVVTAGPGITNSLTAVQNAMAAQIPLVLIGGAPSTLLRGRGALQDIDQVGLLKPIVKQAFSCNRVRDIVSTLRNAFQTASSGVPGPVFVEFPLDVLYPIGEVQASLGFVRRIRKHNLKQADQDHVLVPVEFSGSKQQYLESKDPRAPIFLESKETMPALVKMYMTFKLSNLFANAWDDTEFGPLPVQIPLPHATDISKTIAFLHNASKPLLLVSSQACLDPANILKLQEAVRILGIPIYLDGMARGLVGKESKIELRQNRQQVLKDADCIILAGAVCDFGLDYGRALPSTATIISINRSQKDLTLNSPVFWSATLAAHADPARFLIDLAHRWKDEGCAREKQATFDQWLGHTKELDIKTQKANCQRGWVQVKGRGQRQNQKLTNAYHLLHQLDDILPDDSILIADGGDFVSIASNIVKPRRPLGWLDSGSYGTLGVGAGFALGAKLCRPSAQVWIIWGDGSAGYSVGEWDTLKRHQVPVIGLIGNDACWTKVEKEQVPMFGDDVGTELEYRNYDQVAEAYGGCGITVNNDDEALTCLKIAQKESFGKAVIVNALIGKATNSFRELDI